jgi:NADH-quinone oxidoreductase subunit A
MLNSLVPVLLFVAVAVALVVILLVLANLLNPRRPGRVKRMPYESGMDPIHDTRRRYGVHFHLLAIAFLVFDVELLFLYPWAVVLRPPVVATPASPAASTGAPPTVALAAPLAPPVSTTVDWTPRPVFIGGVVFVALLALGFLYDWRKGIFQWR